MNDNEVLSDVKKLKKQRSRPRFQQYTNSNYKKQKISNGTVDKVILPSNGNSLPMKNKKYRLLVETAKNIGLKCDKAFLDSFIDANEIYIEKKFYLEYDSKEKMEEKKQIIEKMKLNGQPIEVKLLAHSKKILNNSNISNNSQTICYSLSVDVPQSANISDMKRLFPDASHFVKKKRKKGENKKYFIVKYSSKEIAEKDLARSHDLKINGTGIKAKLRDINDQKMPTPTLSAKQRIKNMRKKIQSNLEEKKKKNKLKMMKSKSKETD